MSRKLNQTGFLMPALIGAIIVFGLLAAATLTVVYGNIFVVKNNRQSQTAFNIAEAGINYYLWHLNHNVADFKDGTGTGTLGTYGYGPYTHDYINSNAQKDGSFTLYILPPSNGSTIVTVRSIGKPVNSTLTRTVEAQIGATSFASYAVLSDTALWFGNTETANGPVHSNQGVRMDGANSDQVSAANTTYVPSGQLGGDGASHPGVWCGLTITTPVNCATRSKAAWDYPVASIDFNRVSGSLCSMKKTAFADDPSTAALATQSTACSQVPTTRTAAYLPRRSTTYSVSRGYLIKLNSNKTYNISTVNGENDLLTPYTSALSLTSLATNVPLPPGGVIFAEDNVWVRSNGAFNGRVSIGAGRLADTAVPNISIVGSLTYAAKNGTNVIGLVSEGDIDIAPYAPPASGNFAFEVNGALLAQTGSVYYRGTYRANTSRCTRGWTGAGQTFNFYGAVASRQTWTWTWQTNMQCGDAGYDTTNGYISGIMRNTTTYDYDLLSTPPPGFPVTGGSSILAWREVLTRP